MHLCPNCGIQLKKYETFRFGNVTIQHNADIVFNGQPVPMSMDHRMIAEALIRAEGRVLTRDTLASITDFEGDLQSMTVQVFRARSKFRAVDPTFSQIESVRGMGYRWVYAPAEQANDNAHAAEVG